MATTPNNTGFVHLRVRSEHSIGASVLKPEEIARHAQQLGMPVIGLADIGTLCGAFGFYHEAIALGLKPIIGCELAVGDARVLFFAKNRAGWGELATFVTRAKQGMLDVAMIAAHGSNLVIVDCPGQGIVARILETDDRVDAASAAMSLQRVMPPGSFFLGIGCAGLDGPSALDAEIRDLARAVGVGIALAIPIGRPEQLISDAEALAAFPGFEEAIAGTARIAELCRESSVALGPLNPFPGPPRLDWPAADDLFASLVEGGLAARLSQLREAGLAPDEAKYRARLDVELALVKERHVEMLFLNAAHVATLCGTLGIVKGPGRGAMPSSLLLFALGVTEIDPIVHSLHFEMFFNPERVSLPDIVFEIEAGRERELLAEIADRFREIDAMPATRAERDPDTGLAARHVASPTRLVVCGTGVFDRVPALLDHEAIRCVRADVLEEDVEMFGLWAIDVIPDDALAAVRAALRAQGLTEDKAPDLPLVLIDDARLIARSGPGFKHHVLAPYVAETNGVLYWREQLTAIIAEFFDVPLGRAENYRRALARRPGNIGTIIDLVAHALERGRPKWETHEIVIVLGCDTARALPFKAKLLAREVKELWQNGGRG